MRARMAWMLLAVLIGGCAEREDAAVVPSETCCLVRTESRGPVLLLLEAQPVAEGAPEPGLRRALREAAAEGPCSAATFYAAERIAAKQWAASELARRREAGLPPQLALAGHSWGASAAADLAQSLLDEIPDLILLHLVTVDAVKTGAVRATTSITTTVLTLNNPLPGQSAFFVAHADAPAPDGVRFLAHTNYYQDYIALAHGGPMPHATENVLLQSRNGAINHGNVDEYAYPFVRRDLVDLVRRGAHQ